MLKPDDPLLAALAPGHFVSGEALAGELGVSRAAIWKRLHKLEREGVPIDAVRGRGYRIAGGNPLLTRDAVYEGLSLPVRTQLKSLEVHWSVESTNEVLLQRTYAELPAACIAEMQTAGRGRRGRDWTSPFGAGVWLSLAWPFSQLPSGFSALGLVAGIAAADALLDDIGLKWPNDLVADGAKLGGLLVETRGEAGGQMRAVIGIGINWRMPATAVVRDLDRPWTDLATLTGDPVPRAELAARLCNQLFLALERFEQQGFAGFAARFAELDVLEGKRVRVDSGDGPFHGTARGVDTEGALLVDTGSGRRRCTAGDVSVVET